MICLHAIKALPVYERLQRLRLLRAGYYDMHLPSLYVKASWYKDPMSKCLVIYDSVPAHVDVVDKPLENYR